MKRILFDVARWDIYLHRDARGLEPVDRADPPRRQFEDELFGRLYAGELASLPRGGGDPRLQSWAEGVHAACDQLPAFSRLSGECRGDAGAAAAVVETLMAELAPRFEQLARPDPPQLRRALRSACERAATHVEALREAGAGLEHVAFGRGAGTSCGQIANRTAGAAVWLAQRLSRDERLRRIALLAGRFKRIAAHKRHAKVRHGSDEVTDVALGADLGRLLPVELARLTHPRLRLAALRDLVERKALQYELRGTASLGRGPLVVALDKSGSMEGQPDIWATAVALALLDTAQRERRPFALLGFDARVKYEALVAAGQALPEDGLFIACSGGTSIQAAVLRGLDIIEANPGALRRADVVVVTDGVSDATGAPAVRTRAASLGVSILGIGIGVEPSALAPWCDEAHAIDDLSNLDDRAAEALFAS